MERAERLESRDVQAAEPGTSKVRWGSLWVFRRKGGKNWGVEPVDMILDGAQTRFFTRAVADPTAVGDLWPASLKPDNEAMDMDSDLTKEEGRDWRDHGAYWIQNNKTDGYTSIVSRIAATTVQDSEAVIS